MVDIENWMNKRPYSDNVKKRPCSVAKPETLKHVQLRSVPSFELLRPRGPVSLVVVMVKHADRRVLHCLGRPVNRAGASDRKPKPLRAVGAMLRLLRQTTILVMDQLARTVEHLDPGNSFRRLYEVVSILLLLLGVMVVPRAAHLREAWAGYPHAMVHRRIVSRHDPGRATMRVGAVVLVVEDLGRRGMNPRPLQDCLDSPRVIRECQGRRGMNLRLILVFLRVELLQLVEVKVVDRRGIDRERSVVDDLLRSDCGFLCTFEPPIIAGLG